MSNGNGDSNGNGEKRTLVRFSSAYKALIGAFWAIICVLVAMYTARLEALLADTTERALKNTERIIKLELMNDLRSAGLLKE